MSYTGVPTLRGWCDRYNNEIQTRKQQSQPVVFGSIVQFRHVQSASFLSFSKDQAENDPRAMKVLLL